MVSRMTRRWEGCSTRALRTMLKPVCSMRVLRMRLPMRRRWRLPEQLWAL